MKRKVILTCALTGSGVLGSNSTYVPITPKHIAEEAIAAARAGASACHVHVRDPETGAASMKRELYREVVERIRESGVDMILNLTSGLGARHEPAFEEDAMPGISVMPPLRRVEHILELRPEMCTLDLNTMNTPNYAIVNAPSHLRALSRMIQDASVKPELEVFNPGDIDIARRLLQAGDLPSPPYFQFCLGLPGGAPATPESMLLLKSMLPPDAIWSAFGIGRFQMPMLAQSVILGGNCRVGLEDNLYREYGVLAKSNAALVEQGIAIIEGLGCGVASPDEARAMLCLPDARKTAA